MTILPDIPRASAPEPLTAPPSVAPSGRVKSVMVVASKANVVAPEWV